MFATLTSQGFGPHDGTITFPDPMGLAEVKAPSRAGKTTKTLRLLSWLLWGCEPNGSAPDTSIIQAGVDTAALSSATSKGTVFTRTFKVVLTTDESGAKVPKLDDAGARTFSPTVTMQKAGDPAPMKFASEADFQAQLPAQLRMLPTQRGTSPVRMAFAPFAWLDLAAGNGRPLRDLIAEVSGITGDLRGAVAKAMGAHPLLESDPLTDEDPEVPRGAPKVLGAASLAKAARAAEKEATGAEKEARNALDAVLPVPPPADAAVLTEARQVIADAAAWTKHDAAVTAWTEGETKRAAAAALHAAWTAARADIDAREPKVDVAAQKADAAQVERLDGMLATERRVLAQRATAVATARATLEATRAALASVVPAKDPAPVEPALVLVPPVASSLFVTADVARRCHACNQTLPEAM